MREESLSGAAPRTRTSVPWNLRRGGSDGSPVGPSHGRGRSIPDDEVDAGSSWVRGRDARTRPSAGRQGLTDERGRQTSAGGSQFVQLNAEACPGLGDAFGHLIVTTRSGTSLFSVAYRHTTLLPMASAPLKCSMSVAFATSAGDC